MFGWWIWTLNKAWCHKYSTTLRWRVCSKSTHMGQKIFHCIKMQIRKKSISEAFYCRKKIEQNYHCKIAWQRGQIFISITCSQTNAPFSHHLTARFSCRPVVTHGLWHTCISFPNQPLSIHTKLPVLNFQAVSLVLQIWNKPGSTPHFILDYVPVFDCLPFWSSHTAT